MATKEVKLEGDARTRSAGRRRHPGRCSQGHLGPKGRNVVIDKAFGAPRITKDGVTVAKEIELEDKFENMGAQMGAKSRPKLTTKPVTARQRRPFWRRPSFAKDANPLPLV